MANANVNKKSDVETKSDEPEIRYVERDDPWRPHPSVLVDSQRSIGNDEIDFVD